MTDTWFVPTDNDDKLAAVQQALRELPKMNDAVCVKAEMELLHKPPLRQPTGFTQIHNAAKLRAYRSSERYGNGYHVGIQNGLVSYEMDSKTTWMDQACVYLYFKKDEQRTFSFAWTASVAVPEAVALRVQNGFNELGAIVEFYSKRQDKDAVAFFSRHCARRRDFLADAVLSAFGTLSFKEHSEKLLEEPVLKVVGG